MSIRFTDEWLKEYQERTGKGAHEESRKAAPDDTPIQRPGKYRNIKTDVEGETFDSRKEARQWRELKTRGMAGEFAGLARQVDFFLPGGVKYRADFVTLNKDGTFTVYDTKSEATAQNKVYRLKKKQMENCLGIKIKEI